MQVEIFQAIDNELLFPNGDLYGANEDYPPLGNGWYWWRVEPGEMATGQPCGPFASEAEARIAALKGA